MGHKESIADTAAVLGRMYDAIEFRGSGQEDVEELAGHAGVPVYNGLTNEWHPTQMLADFLTMHERSHRPPDEIAYAFVGDCRFNMGRSLLVMGAILGTDVRLVGPDELRPPDDVVEHGRATRGRLGRADHDHRRSPPAVEGVDFVHTDVWVSMGEAKDVWAERAELLTPVPGQRRRCSSAPATRRSSSCTACPPSTTTRRRSAPRSWRRPGCTDGLEVTDEVFDSPASIVFDQAENRLHTIKAVLVATLA